MTDYKKEKMFQRIHKFYWISGAVLYILAGMCGLVLLIKYITIFVIYLIS